MATTARQKELGAFYTQPDVAAHLVHWAVRSPDEQVVDPSCGEGVFVSILNERLLELGSRRPRVYGIDIEPEATRRVKLFVPTATVLTGDFFQVRSESLPKFDAVVGNPPFIRYQSFKGEQRDVALLAAASLGVKLPRLSSSWAPFLVYATAFLKHNGRLAMVVPSELGHAQYARNVLKYLATNFASIKVEIFRHKLFSDLSQSTVLLLCEGFGQECQSATAVLSDSLGGPQATTEIEVPISEVKAGRVPFLHLLLSDRVRRLYRDMSLHRSVVRVGDVADVGIGYVTGANDFFHLSRQEADTLSISKRFLDPAILSLGRIAGVRFDSRDWASLRDSDEKIYLLHVPPVPESDLPPALLAYLKQGTRKGIHNRFKCGKRQYWYSVPHVRAADAFLSYMSGDRPKVVLNETTAVAPNTVHTVRFDRRCRPAGFVAGWNTSLTELSCEMEGHPLGGGLLKLEPSEAENVIVPLSLSDSSKFISDLDNALRQGNGAAASEHADARILRKEMGLTTNEVALLREAAAEMRAWRRHNRM